MCRASVSDRSYTELHWNTESAARYKTGSVKYESLPLEAGQRLRDFRKIWLPRRRRCRGGRDNDIAHRRALVVYVVWVWRRPDPRLEASTAATVHIPDLT